MVISGRFYELRSHVQHYSWGCCTRGDDVAYISDLVGAEPDSRPWAELWIGAHPSLSSEVDRGNGWELLNEVIASDTEGTLGGSLLSRGFNKLPFLLKVLSCERALSIQSHPDLEWARRLHCSNPRRYPDANHKPEIMIALTEFYALAGFRSTASILDDLECLGSIRMWRQIWREAVELTPRVFCETLLNLPGSVARVMLQDLRRELKSRREPTEREALALWLLDQHPCDRGVLFAFLLNYLRFEPGSCVYIPPNEPHAYLRGTGVECMANSDNVIRAGLTSKTIDIRALLGTLTFKSGSVKVCSGISESGGVTLFKSPAREFQVRFIRDVRFDVSRLAGVPGVALVLSGSWHFRNESTDQVGKRGSSWFWPASMRCGTLEPEGDDCLVVIATVPLEDNNEKENKSKKLKRSK